MPPGRGRRSTRVEPEQRWAVADAFTSAGPVIHTLPPVVGAPMVLLSISHAGYLVKKAVPLAGQSART